MKRTLRFERFLRAPPDLVWAELTEPARMAQWSLARITLLEPGDRGHPGGAGALRRVSLPFLGRELHLREVVRDAAPPTRLGYRVIAGAPVRRHDGRIRIAREAEGCRLRWEVDLEATPAVVAAAAAAVAPALERSLDRLAARLPHAPAADLPAFADLTGAPDAALWSRSEAILAEQRALAAELFARGDPTRWFARVYAYVTEGQLAACRRGAVVHPEWVLRLIPRFHHYFVDNLQRWGGAGDGARAEAHWRRAFTAMERGSRRYPDERGRLFVGLFLAIRAHIEADLPRTLAEVWVDHYHGECDYVRFRGDYLTMGDVFEDASERLIDDIPRRHIPAWARTLRRALPGGLQERLRHRRFYDIPRRRSLAFARGEEIANLLAARAQPAEPRPSPIATSPRPTCDRRGDPLP